MASSNIDALPYYDKQVENPGEPFGSFVETTRLTVGAAKAAAQAMIEAELRPTQQITLDDPRLPPDVAVFPVCLKLLAD